MPPKRRAPQTSDDDGSDHDAAPVPTPAKKSRASTGTVMKEHTLESLLALPHDDLAKYALNLQVQVIQLQQSGGGSGEAAWTDEKIHERATKTRDICKTEIKKQMKWQPSCKTGTTKWSYTGLVPHEDVFYKLFGFEKLKKPWKQKKLDMGEFEDRTGHINNSSRYNDLKITSTEVKVHWDAEEKTFRLTETYGL